MKQTLADDECGARIALWEILAGVLQLALLVLFLMLLRGCGERDGSPAAPPESPDDLGCVAGSSSTHEDLQLYLLADLDRVALGENPQDVAPRRNRGADCARGTTARPERISPPML